MKGNPDDMRPVWIAAIIAGAIVLLFIVGAELWVALETGREHWSP